MSERSMTWLAWILSAGLVAVGLGVRVSRSADSPSDACAGSASDRVAVAVVVHQGSPTTRDDTAVEVYWLDAAGLMIPKRDGQPVVVPEASSLPSSALGDAIRTQ